MLGRGGAGQVELVQHLETGQYFAKKTIPLAHLSDKERQMAEQEVLFLKVLTGPTLIKSYSSFIETNNIYIIMEYAEGGTLSDEIAKHIRSKTPFDSDQILKWAAQIVLGVMLMHSKSILH